MKYWINHGLRILIFFADVGDPVCTLNEYLLVDQIREEKEKVVEAIVNVLPFDLPVPKSDSSSQLAYEKLAKHFKQTPSAKGQNEFRAAVDEIYTSYTSECVGDSGDVPGTNDILVLAATFRELTRGLNSIRRDNLTQARDIYGKFLCYEEKRGGARRKRQSADAYNTPTECECPESGVTEPCHFFACLNVSVIKFISGFGNSKFEQPCIGFIIDTTGSMWNEIEAARRVILQFIKSQADSTDCYLLVPFNDHGVNNSNSKYT